MNKLLINQIFAIIIGLLIFIYYYSFHLETMKGKNDGKKKTNIQ